MKLLDRVADPHESIEFSLRGRGLLLGIAFLSIPLYFIFYPSNWLILFHWSWLSACWALVVLLSILRNIKWSPIYAGPILIVDTEGISGRGGVFDSAWKVSWDQIEKFEWGRNGLFLYKKNMKNWEVPIRQGGVGGPRLVQALNARLSAYASNKGDPQEEAA
ncbi:hypothetical protein RHM58_29375 [Pseudomonas sp. 10S4]|uniref:hypothetical protein n=2 Tax=Pseudomonas TaxID=286 RepID=UPI00191223F6|nr:MULTISPECIES: hypothetical protein [unclassified Pseudomonas]MBK5554225.1 hypothetical protein [Pseudomonas sp. TH03]MEB0224404.1 hypothetical protein [Pseudomonas sp. 5S1]WPX17866.1 hypothetical protein RHM58_29375 [Pseudomonas sp. 10S4]